MAAGAGHGRDGAGRATGGPGLDSLAGPTSASVHRILRNSAFNLATQGLYGVFHLAVVFALARALGKGLLGSYYTIYAVVLVVQLVVEAGVGTLLTRRIARTPAAWREVAAEGAGLFTAIAIISAVAVLGVGVAGAW